jgi:hypothetical protein
MSFPLELSDQGMKLPDHSPSSGAKVKIVWSVTPLPHTSAWGCIWLSIGQVYLLFFIS